MPTTNSAISSPKPDYNAPSFRGALTCDLFASDVGGDHATVPSNLIGDIQRASDAIRTISRLVHNSLCEPAMSGAEPLGLSAHLGLMNAAELIGQYLRETAEQMHGHARCVASLEQKQEADHE
ncbi:hypothetical protein K6W16_10485 [Burkholderia dolosa]|uniref:DUF3077 domain-containing protein n=1 Tax=Burkholderia dolosa TaxID=152500 RepID=A0A892IAG3_9BURK|nr:MULTISPECIES: hypothetical protein [Burkholderia]AJY11650.1 hypothetical protein AK34_706 [Burkholderia dolosa AU0158]MBR8419823.1 hypothetical protein [Burkholderia dolosa]MBY4657919.1 hypothetical protein [Burkholderia dolosa]MBY4690060.1 hypothetical protein [Burkholderia dolosa]MBY4782798.1 hypothetical protein [Burkholderia dolosa]